MTFWNPGKFWHTNKSNSRHRQQNRPPKPWDSNWQNFPINTLIPLGSTQFVKDRESLCWSRVFSCFALTAIPRLSVFPINVIRTGDGKTEYLTTLAGPTWPTWPILEIRLAKKPCPVSRWYDLITLHYVRASFTHGCRIKTVTFEK